MSSVWSVQGGDSSAGWPGDSRRNTCLLNGGVIVPYMITSYVIAAYEITTYEITTYALGLIFVYLVGMCLATHTHGVRWSRRELGPGVDACYEPINQCRALTSTVKDVWEGCRL